MNSSFRDDEHVDDVLTTPSPALVRDLETVAGDIIVLGVGGRWTDARAFGEARRAASA